MNAKRILFWLILLFFIGMTAWWIFYFPYSREKLYRAIPANAVLVSEHGKLAERWKSIARNPFTLCVLSTAGFKQKNLREAVMDPGLVAFIQKFASKNTVIAYVPFMSANGDPSPAWVLSSWVGGSGQLYRWYTSGMLAEANLKKVRLENGRSIWQIAKKESPSDPDLSFAMIEGVLLACLSHDPAGVKYLINRIECGAPVHSGLADQIRLDSMEMKNTALDRGFVRVRVEKDDGITIRGLRYEFTALGGNDLKGWVKGDMDILQPWTGAGSVQTNGEGRAVSCVLDNSQNLAGLPAILGRSPDAIAVMPFSLVEPALSGRNSPMAARLITRAVKSQAVTNTAMFVSMFGGDLSGRILGIKVPALIAGVCVRDGSNTVAKASETVDVLNALYKASLIPRRDEFDGRPVIVIDSTRQQGIYDSIAPTDKPALTIKDGWLAISSSLGTMTNVLSGAIDRKKRPQMPWMNGVKDVKDCGGYLWVDLDSAGEAVKNAVAAYSLALIAQNAAGTVETRRNLAMLQTWINVLKPVKTAELKLFFLDTQFEVKFSFGRYQP